jgi:drug/metabolite transporter (DMT)-like permease
MVENQSVSSSALPLVAMLAVVVGNVLGNVLLKIGSSVEPGKAMLLGMFGWQTAAGIGCFASGVLFYAFALKSLPLHVAQAITALQFVGAIGAAAILFGEPITNTNWAGIALICAGLILVLARG